MADGAPFSRPLTTMRLLAVLVVIPVVIFGALVLTTNVFRPAPAADRLPGVSVRVTGHSTEDLGDRRHRLRLSVKIDSRTDIDECLGFTLDEPFAGRLMTPESGACLRPKAGRQIAALTFDKLTDDDLAFTAHTLVWGIPGGRCGPILEAFGVCVVEQAGTADFELPGRAIFPSFGSFGPLFSFYSLPP
jgi:hypothetical protein